LKISDRAAPEIFILSGEAAKDLLGEARVSS